MGSSHSANPPRHLATQRQRSSQTLDPFHETTRAANEKLDGDTSSVAYASNLGATQDEEKIAYDTFLKMFPEYRRTWILDTLRRTEFTRLDRTGEIYVDYMGGSLYPESLVRVHASFLNTHVLGNTHSVSNSSKLSTRCSEEARAAVLSFFQAPPEYTVVFTANATGSLKLVGESYPFTEGSSFILGVDSHNSVNGIREFASRRGARVCYIESTSRGGFDFAVANKILQRNQPQSRNLHPSLLALTGQSNISNSKIPLSILRTASSLGYHVLLDAAGLAPTSMFSLSDTPVDAMAISFYKMFGYPTGVGALVVKKSFLGILERPWFSGGNVDVVQVPGTIVTRTSEIHEQFEDGTINYLTLSAVTDGLTFLSAYMPFLPLRLSCLVHFLTLSLLRLRHDTTGAPVVSILSRTPTRRLKSVGEQSDTGFVVSLIFLSDTGKMTPNSFVEYAASKESISLRTGCMCNPGGTATMQGIEEGMQRHFPGVTRKDFENIFGKELGVVRISLGLASSFHDIWKVIRFAAKFGVHKSRQAWWDSWMHASSIGQAI